MMENTEKIKKFDEFQKKMIKCTKNNSIKISDLFEFIDFNKENVHTFLDKSHDVFKFLPDILKNDRSILIKSLKIDPKNFLYASEYLRNDENLAIEILKKDSNILKECSDKIKNSEFVYKNLNKFYDKFYEGFAYFNENIKNNKSECIELIKKDVYFYDYISDSLKQDKEIILETLKKIDYKNKKVNEFFSNLTKKNQEDLDIFYMTLVKSHEINKIIETLKLRENNIFSKAEKIAEILIKREKIEFVFNSFEVKDNTDLIMKAINQNPLIGLKFANKEQRNDKNLMLKAILKNVNSYSFCSIELKNDRDFLMELLKKITIEDSEKLYKIINLNLKEDKLIFTEFIKKNIVTFKSLPENIKNDKFIVYELMIENKLNIFNYINIDWKKEYKTKTNFLNYLEKEIKEIKTFKLLSKIEDTIGLKTDNNKKIKI